MNILIWPLIILKAFNEQLPGKLALLILFLK